MSDDYVWVCSECGGPIVTVELDSGLRTFECPTHGRRGVFMALGEVSLDDIGPVEGGPTVTILPPP